MRPILKLPSIFCYEFDLNFAHNRIESIQFKEETMKISKICILFFAELILFTALPSQAGEKTNVTSVDIFDPFNLFSSGYIGTFYDFGTFECPGNEPTRPCPVGSRSRIRGIVFHSRHSSSDPRLNGWSTLDYNSNLDPDGKGPTWGKWKIEVDPELGGGVWEGVYNGGKPFGERVEFHGTGGLVDGLLLKMETTSSTIIAGGIAYWIEYAGYIVDPHEKK